VPIKKLVIKSQELFIKRGAESQKYKCKHCVKVYMQKPKERIYGEEI